MTLTINTSKFLTDALNHLNSRPDIEIVLSDLSTFKANRTILSITCDRFANMITDEMTSMPIKGVSSDIFSKVLQLTHTGLTNVQGEGQVARFLEAAAYLGIRHLDTSIATLRPAASIEVTREQEMEMISEAATQLILEASEAATDIEEVDDEDDGTLVAVAEGEDDVAVCEDEHVVENIEDDTMMAETNKLFKTLSESLIKKGSDESEESDSGRSSKSSKSKKSLAPVVPLAPINAILKRGICGKFWQCRRCNFWCYTDPEVRRHEAKFHDYDISEAEEEDRLEVAGKTDLSVALKLRRREMEEAERRKKKAAAKKGAAKKKEKNNKGDHFRCLRCPYWCYTRGGMLLHEKRNKCNKKF